jgi:hypothetical protein
MIKVKFRPSSHSDDHTLLATFDTAIKAKNAACAIQNEIKRKSGRNGLFEDRENPHFECEGRSVFYHGYDAFDSLSPVIRLFKGKAGLKMIYSLEREYARITVNVPAARKPGNAPRLNPALFALLYPAEQIEVIQKLKRLCETRLLDAEDGAHLVFTYIGNAIFEKPLPVAGHKIPSKHLLSFITKDGFCDIDRRWENWHIRRVPPKVYKALKPTLKYTSKPKTKTQT